MARKVKRKLDQSYHFNEHDKSQVEGIRRKRKAIKLKKQVKIILFLLTIILFGVYFTNDISYVKTIVINGNTLLSNEEIIQTLNIDETSRHFFLIPMILEDKLENQPLIQNATITKGLFNNIYITIEEVDIIAYISDNNLRVIDANGNIETITVDASNKLKEIQNNPRVKGFSDEELLEKFAKKFIEAHQSIRTQISDITYDPTELLQTRLRLDMRDGTIVYIEIEELDSLNNYSNLKALYNDKCTTISFEGKYAYGSGEGCEYTPTNE